MNVIKSPKITSADWKHVCDTIIDMYKKRKEDRRDLEKEWDEIDRQLRMEPSGRHKLDSDGKPDKNKAWLSDVELPLQSQALEILTADARRMRFPDSGSFFSAHAAITDEYLNRVEETPIITGDLAGVPSIITQDNADKLVQGTLDLWHRQYDFRSNCDQIDSEAFKYGVGVGRARMVLKQIDYQGVKGALSNAVKIPMLVPRSIKDTYLDDNPHHLMNEGVVVRPSIIAHKFQLLTDVILAAKAGGSDPDSQYGGWMMKNIMKLEKDKKGNVEILELEGDLIFPRKTKEDVYVENVIVTVAMGDSGTRSVIRYRHNDIGESSYIIQPYHLEHLDSPYGTSPLIKGRPIQSMAVEALNKYNQVASLHAHPPVTYESDDPHAAALGGPEIYPGSSTPANGPIQVHMIGDPVAMYNSYASFLQQYADTTGINAPRLGAQTVSHTTAYAKEAEISRGTIRTVDYVKSSLKGPMERWLQLAYRLGKKYMKKSTVYMEPYGGFVDISSKQLPDRVEFDVHGSGGPAEEQAKSAAKLNALQMALQIEQVGQQHQQAGTQSKLSIDAAMISVLKEGGWTEDDQILSELQQQEQPDPNFTNVSAGQALTNLADSV